MENCVFCKIVKEEIPCYKVYEDDNFLAFLDIKPLNLGHILVIPKNHYRWVWDVLNLGDYFETVGKIAQAMKKALKIDQVISLVFGDEVPHAHVWLVPKFPGDGQGDAPIDLRDYKNFTTEQMAQVAEKIRREL
jgi:histidine triad (HIT) family protein